MESIGHSPVPGILWGGDCLNCLQEAAAYSDSAKVQGYALLTARKLRSLTKNKDACPFYLDTKIMAADALTKTIDTPELVAVWRNLLSGQVPPEWLPGLARAEQHQYPEKEKPSADPQGSPSTGDQEKKKNQSEHSCSGDRHCQALSEVSVGNLYMRSLTVDSILSTQFICPL